jgi:hypothetical protein
MIATVEPQDDDARRNDNTLIAAAPLQVLDPCTLQVADGELIIPPLCPVQPVSEIDVTEIFIPEIAELGTRGILASPIDAFIGVDDDQANLLSQALRVETVGELLNSDLIRRIAQLRNSGVV